MVDLPGIDVSGIHEVLFGQKPSGSQRGVDVSRTTTSVTGAGVMWMWVIRCGASGSQVSLMWTL
ncbi:MULTISPECIES: hypothetical protein [Streptomyces]|uniref:Uncharacterized protein n=2 Tax=Streptomyces TaxID=1883 RepID=A0ABU2XDX6_9ACTN|nr:hypothetical protein [Streptomyces sp. DSM 41529]MDT0543148.1 hypothetical protein [Streptomyces sp. DSM 41529]